MSLSSVCVVINALRLRKFKTNFKQRNNNSKENKNIIDEDLNKVIKSKEIIKEEKKMNTKKVNIEGMQCNHCKMSVEKALNSIEGIEKVEVDLEGKKATIETSKEIENTKIKEVIEEAGFEVIEIK